MQGIKIYLKVFRKTLSKKVQFFLRDKFVGKDQIELGQHKWPTRKMQQSGPFVEGRNIILEGCPAGCRCGYEQRKACKSIASVQISSK